MNQERSFSLILFLLLWLYAGMNVCALSMEENSALKAIDPSQAQYGTEPVAPSNGAYSGMNRQVSPAPLGRIQGEPIDNGQKRTLANPNPSGTTYLEEDGNDVGQPDNNAMAEQRVTRLEQIAFGSAYPEHEVDDRVDHLEVEVFGRKMQNQPQAKRLAMLEAKLGGAGAFTAVSQSMTQPVLAMNPVSGQRTVPPPVVNRTFPQPGPGNGNPVQMPQPPGYNNGYPRNTGYNNAYSGQVPQPPNSNNGYLQAVPQNPGYNNGYPGQVPQNPGYNNGYPGQVPQNPGYNNGYPGQVPQNPGYNNGYPGQVPQNPGYNNGYPGQMPQNQGYNNGSPGPVPQNPDNIGTVPSVNKIQENQTASKEQPTNSYEAAVKAIPFAKTAGDYFANINKFASGCVARWTSLPVRIHLPEGSPAAWEKLLEGGIAKWNQYFPVKVVPVSDPCDIELAWINHLPPKQLGLTNLEIFNGRLRVTIYMLRPTYYLPSVPEKSLAQVAMHEVGHAIGLFGHSTVPSDLMFPLESAPGKDLSRTKSGGISARDLNTLKRVYESPALPPGFQSPHPMGWAESTD